jgi:eukaryotic-like serine/threonine-protein kinase
VSFLQHFKSRKAIKIYIICALLLVLGTVCDRAILPWYVNLGGVLKVPSVIGLKEEAAFRLLQKADLLPLEGGKRYDAQYPEGTVIFQSPLPGTNVREGRRIYLTISGGEEFGEVPDLSGRTLRDAKIALLNCNLRLGSVTYDSASVLPNEVVVGQSQPKFKKVKPGSYIGVVLSFGVKQGQIKVPGLTNKSVTEATNILHQNNLSVGKINYVIRIDLNPNTVIDQFPRAGNLVNEGQPVELWVTKDAEINFPEN